MVLLRDPGLKGPGVKPPQRGLFKKEVIGADDCPLMHRWTLPLTLGGRVKVLLHHFLPNADDRDVHDHPRPFVTLVLKGGYDNLVPCPRCRRRQERDGINLGCAHCFHENGLVVGDHMTQGTVRFRAARHAHRTRVGPNGAWTLVLMGPLQRPWGFWRGRHWWGWREYEERFGLSMRCEDDR